MKNTEKEATKESIKIQSLGDAVSQADGKVTSNLFANEDFVNEKSEQITSKVSNTIDTNLSKEEKHWVKGPKARLERGDAKFGDIVNLSRRLENL